MRRSALLLMTMLAGWKLLCAIPQSGIANSQAATAASSAGRIGPSAVWQPPQDYVTKAHAACDKSANSPDVSECFIKQMSDSGAPAAAVSFTRTLYQQNGGMVGIMTAFKQYGAVDAAQVFYPLRANDNYVVLLVNGDPPILDVDDMQKLDHGVMKQDPMFQSVKQRFPQTDVWPGDRSGSDPWPRVQPLPGGGTEFIVSYPLLNGCHACQRVGVARFAWDFDASGKFLHTKFIPTPPPPRILPRPHTPLGQPAQPSPPAQTPAPQQSPPPQ